MQKAQIIQSAITILDRDGLDGVTLRRLATELGVKAASIYWHIANKETLLDEMANAMLTEHFGVFDFANDQRDWAEWLHTLAHELRRCMLAHREGARVVAGAHPDIAVMLTKLADLSIRVLHHNGFSYGQAGVITYTLINFTFGSIIEEQASPPLNHLNDVNSILSHAAQFPAFLAMLEAWKQKDNETLFDTGVQIFINGVYAELQTAKQA